MTKYILHGGNALDVNQKNDEFFKVIIDIEKTEIKILIIPFAIEEKMFKIDFIKVQFEKNKSDKKLNFEVANIQNIESQIMDSDIIYLNGGKTLKLLYELTKYKNFKELFDNKVVAGESAGAYVLSSCFYSKSIDICSEGLKLVPVKTICHYEGDNRNRLENCPDTLEELLLANYEYKIFNI